MCFLFLASLLTSECFQPQCFMCVCVCVPPLHPSLLQHTHTCMGHLHNYTQYVHVGDTHRGVCQHTRSQIKPHACRETCRRGDRDDVPKQRLWIFGPQSHGPSRGRGGQLVVARCVTYLVFKGGRGASVEPEELQTVLVKHPE